ncbi:hypothetical protein TSUD_180640 [Trifolium subterraneum]|uniref:Uncharacterized protein n=1 Tax=Trifolium subterraneum TaxID=3900 RepID=A0A2Z6PIR9_TRISU|nr:hypothetical protein TSUD_180640 [Trifolium subterraneum]
MGEANPPPPPPRRTMGEYCRRTETKQLSWGSDQGIPLFAFSQTGHAKDCLYDSDLKGVGRQVLRANGPE